MYANHDVDELLDEQQNSEWVKSLELLNDFNNDQNDYFVVYKKEDQATEHEMQFNKVTRIDAENYLIAMHNEDYHEGIRYYTGEDIRLNRLDIINVKVVDPSEFDFVVFTD
ncbi:hypothetical protein [Aquibacillus rhizosphaerae]|uniref:Uncharacterized protein n=1 Tax=Aquibacillus rhizosphaerae TaxID=3051431 RepID=A0ABT7L8U1_9BACI|nr:hypothetical protein [Aquibacillus sp. LR5S19]MDL4841642.1 hypothetical protein [Aquibacillus sp. LR5S19]